MAHNLEMAEDGRVAFALRGAPAWHGLADKVFGEDETVTTAEMLEAAHLADWQVRLEPLSAPDGYRVTKNAFMVVRNNPFDAVPEVMGTVGKKYTTFQNEDLLAFGDGLVDGGAAYESAGSIDHGRRVFASMRLGRDITIDGQGIADTVTSYLLVTTSHDGSSAVQALTTPVRVVCQNTLTAALRKAQQSYKVRHTASVQGRVEEARRALGISFAYLDAFEEEANALFAAALTDKQFGDIVEALYPTPEQGAAAVTLTKHQNKVDTLWSLYNGPTQVGIRGTGWGAYNALTERIDWYRSGRGADASDNLLAAASGFDPVVNSEKQRILAAVREFAGV